MAEETNNPLLPIIREAVAAGRKGEVYYWLREARHEVGVYAIMDIDADDVMEYVELCLAQDGSPEEYMELQDGEGTEVDKLSWMMEVEKLRKAEELDLAEWRPALEEVVSCQWPDHMFDHLCYMRRHALSQVIRTRIGVEP